MKYLEVNGWNLVENENLEGAWITAEELGRHLGYSDPRTGVMRLFGRKSKRFKEQVDTSVVKLTTDAGLRETRIFSRRGSLKIIRLSSTEIADDIMDEVIDVYLKVQDLKKQIQEPTEIFLARAVTVANKLLIETEEKLAIEQKDHGETREKLTTEKKDHGETKEKLAMTEEELRKERYEIYETLEWTRLMMEGKNDIANKFKIHPGSAQKCIYREYRRHFKVDLEYEWERARKGASKREYTLNSFLTSNNLNVNYCRVIQKLLDMSVDQFRRYLKMRTV